MKKWLCLVCGWIYDEAKGWPDDGIAPGTRWEDIPEDWLCPECQVGKADFEMIEISTNTAITPPTSNKSSSTSLPVNTISTNTQAISTAMSVSSSFDVTKQSIVIVGSGHAGYSLAVALRAKSADLPITIFCEDNAALYSKPALSNALSLHKNSDDLLRETALSWEKRLNIRLYPHTKVTAIDRQNKLLNTSIGDYPYTKLILATGATPIVIDIAGDKSAVLNVNDLADYARFRQRLAAATHITILGDGLIGCEFANDLASHGLPVTVVGLGQWVMQRLIPQPLGDALQNALSQMGVTWQLNNSITNIASTSANNDIIDKSHQYQITLKDGQHFTTDLVLSAVGLLPNIALAKQAGLSIGKGISTNDAHQTNDPAIYALGDCAEMNGQWLPYINPINQALPALVDNILNSSAKTVHQPAPVIVKTPILPLSLLPAFGQGEWVVENHEGELSAGYYDNGQLKGFALLGHKLQQHRHEWLEKHKIANQ